MKDHVLGAVKGDERDKDLRIAHDNFMLLQAAPRLAQMMVALIETRTVEAESAKTDTMTHQLNGYIMGLQDLYLAVSGYALDIRSKPTESEATDERPF